MKHDTPRPPRAIQLFSTIFFSIAGVTLLFCSLFIPPVGEVHPTVLAAFGMILTFIGTSIGIDYNAKIKYYEVMRFLHPGSETPKPKRSTAATTKKPKSSISLSK